jgi:CheY-like chemotaxis protein
MDAIPALSGREALNALERTPNIELMLSDVMMPGIDGVELARQAKEIQPRLRVILSSGYSGPTHEATAGQLEGFAFLPKPYKLADVVRKLRELA